MLGAWHRSVDFKRLAKNRHRVSREFDVNDTYFCMKV